METVPDSSVVTPIKRLLKFTNIDSVAKENYDYLTYLLTSRNKFHLSIQNIDVRYPINCFEDFHAVRSMIEPDVLRSALADVNSDDVFYDVGANIGIWSCLIGKKLSDGHLVSIEPHPGNFDRLKKNLSHNGIGGRVVQCALSDDTGQVSLSVAVDSDTTIPRHNLIEITNQVETYSEGTEKQSVKMLSGDELIAKTDLSPPSVMKIDVEGNELKVLKGFKETLRNEQCRLVYCEVHFNHLSKFGATKSEVHDFLKSCGYNIEIVTEEAGRHFIRATS